MTHICVSGCWLLKQLISSNVISACFQVLSQHICMCYSHPHFLWTLFFMWYTFRGRGDDVNLSASRAECKLSSCNFRRDPEKDWVWLGQSLAYPFGQAFLEGMDAIVSSSSVACVVEQGDQQIHQIHIAGIPNKNGNDFSRRREMR